MTSIRLFPPAIFLLILLTSCAQRQVHSSDEDQLRQLSREIEASSFQQFSGFISTKQEPSRMVTDPKKLIIKEQEKVKPRKKIKGKIYRSIPNPIKVKKLINSVKEKKGFKNSEENGFIKYIILYIFYLLIVLLLVYFTGINPAIAIMIFLGLFALVVYASRSH
jgi:ATP-dependent Zn protease